MNSDLYLRYKIQDFLDNFLCESIDITFEGRDSFISFEKDRINISIEMVKDKPIDIQAQLCQGLILHEVSHLWFTRDDCAPWYKTHKVTRFEANWINVLEDFRIELKSKAKSIKFKELLELVNQTYRQTSEKFEVPQCDYIWQTLFCDPIAILPEEKEAFDSINGAEDLLRDCMQPTEIQPLEKQLKLAKLIKPESEEEQEQVIKMIQQVLQQMFGEGNLQPSSSNSDENGETSNQQTEESQEESNENKDLDDVVNRIAEAVQEITIEPDDKEEKTIYNGGSTKVERSQDALKNQKTLSYGYWNWSKGYSKTSVSGSKLIKKELEKNKVTTTKTAQRNFIGRFNLRAAMQPNNYKWFVNQEVVESCKDVLFVFDTSCASHSMCEDYMTYFYRIIKSIPKDADCLTMSFNIKNIKDKDYYPECGKFVFEKFDYLVNSVQSKYKTIVLYSAQPLNSNEFKKYKNNKKVVIKSIKELIPLLTK